ncbi:hypothetical protein F4808DRAFT_9680 [Astrocystis sublimbata]|nr:hypothetical protein F4808DRAFT_9680 [Astrocystis sublimbata]
MADLPSQHPNLSLHLTDRTLTPLITSARTSQHLSHLASLTSTAQAAYESALRFGLGPAQRIMVEHDDGDGDGAGPVLLQTYLSPIPPRRNPSPNDQSATHPPNPTTSNTNGREDSSRHTPSPHQGALALAVVNRNNTATPQPPTSGSGAVTSTYHTTASTVSAHALLSVDDSLDGAYEYGHEYGHEYDEDENPDAPPMLFGLVVAPSADDTREARRAAARLEVVGRQIQRHWSELQYDQSATPHAHG